MLLPLSFFSDAGDVLDTRLFSVNGTPITLASVLLFAAGLLLALALSRRLGRATVRRLVRRADIEPGLEFALVRMLQYAVAIIGVIVSLQFIGIDLATVAVIFGFLAVGIGFGLQNVTANVVSGLILLVERPIRVGDRIQVGDIEGDVREIGLRSTVVRTLANATLVLPNSTLIEGQVINLTVEDPRMALWVDVGVSHASDLETVVEALRQVAAENPDALADPPPIVQLAEFGDSAWTMRVIVWIADPVRVRTVRSDLNMAIVRMFRARGIEIPFPQRDLHLRAPLPFPVAAVSAGSEPPGAASGPA